MRDYPLPKCAEPRLIQPNKGAFPFQGVCPACSKGTAILELGDLLRISSTSYVGLGRSSLCSYVVVVVAQHAPRLGGPDGYYFFPGSKPQLNLDEVPENVAWPIREALECCSNRCYTASAVLIRKALEHLCLDQ